MFVSLLSLARLQVAVKLAPVTEWLPLKQPRPRSSSATVAAALESLSIIGSSDETKQATTEDHSTCAEASAATGASSPSQAWQGPDAAPEMEGLWRPSPKVARGAGGESRSSNLCEAGILAEQGNLQPRGKVVFILEMNHRVSDVLPFPNP